MGRLVVKLFIHPFFAPALPEQRDAEAEQIGAHRRAEHPYIAPGPCVPAVVGQEQVLQQRNAAAQQRQEHYDCLPELLRGSLFFFLQLFKLAAGQAGKHGGIRVLLFFSLIIVKHTNNLFHTIVSISIIFTGAI